MTDDCLFCKIVAGEIPADIVLETPGAVAFRDISPQAPTHVLVVPREHQPNAVASTLADPTTAAALLEAAGKVATVAGLTDYRLVFNTGEGAGQSVFHTHLHVLGGRALQWPPG